jgi:hypothetical protein
MALDNASASELKSHPIMKSNALTNLLVGLVVLTVLATTALALYYVRSVQKLNGLQLQTSIINRNRALASSLVNDAVEYSKRNPAIDPILQSIGVKPRAASSSAPSVKP